MENKTTFAPGYSIEKPVLSQADCNAYSRMAQAVNEHNAACGETDTRWAIEEQESCYVIVEVQPLTDEELAERKAQKERQDKIDRMPETVEQLQAENKILREKLEQAQSAQTDTDSLMVDQEYRLTLMELGV